MTLRAGFFWKNKIDQCLARLREKTYVTEIRNEGGNITNEASEIKRLKKEYYEQFNPNKLDNLE